MGLGILMIASAYFVLAVSAKRGNPKSLYAVVVMLAIAIALQFVAIAW